MNLSHCSSNICYLKARSRSPLASLFNSHISHATLPLSYQNLHTQHDSGTDFARKNEKLVLWGCQGQIRHNFSLIALKFKIGYLDVQVICPFTMLFTFCDLYIWNVNWPIHILSWNEMRNFFSFSKDYTKMY